MSVHYLDIRKNFASPQFPVIPLDPDQWRNGMVVRMPNHLGDAVMALPALEQLKKIIPPHCALFVVCPEYLRSLFNAATAVDGVMTLSCPHKIWSVKEILQLKRLRMGYGVIFSNSLRDSIMFRIAGVPALYGAAARCRGSLFRRTFEFPPRPDHVLAQIHQANRYLAMARAMGAPEWDGSMPSLRPEAHRDEITPFIADLCEHSKMLVLGAGAAYGAAKRWMPENFRVVAHYWVRHGGIVIAVGSRSEREGCAEIFDGLSDRKTFNLAGESSLLELMHLLKYSAAVVANDSGVMHLAAALGRPGVAVFGPTDYTATGPIYPKWSILYEKTACSPCFSRECPKHRQDCIKAITPMMVIKELHKIEQSLPSRRHQAREFLSLPKQ